MGRLGRGLWGSCDRGEKQGRTLKVLGIVKGAAQKRKISQLKKDKKNVITGEI